MSRLDSVETLLHSGPGPCPIPHLFRASGGVGDRPEVRSRSGGHALIPDDACAGGGGGGAQRIRDKGR